jgi:NADPH:quinone reductase
VSDGEIKLPISKNFHLEEIVDAHDFMENNHGSGNIVVVTAI